MVGCIGEVVYFVIVKGFFMISEIYKEYGLNFFGYFVIMFVDYVVMFSKIELGDEQVKIMFQEMKWFWELFQNMVLIFLKYKFGVVIWEIS